MNYAIIKNADQLFARLGEVEKIQIRSATPGALEFMRMTQFFSDGPPSSETMTEIKTRLDTAYQNFTHQH